VPVNVVAHCYRLLPRPASSSVLFFYVFWIPAFCRIIASYLLPGPFFYGNLPSDLMPPTPIVHLGYQPPWGQLECTLQHRAYPPSARAFASFFASCEDPRNLITPSVSHSSSFFWFGTRTSFPPVSAFLPQVGPAESLLLWELDFGAVLG